MKVGRTGVGMTKNEAYLYAIQDTSSGATTMDLGLFVANTGELRGFYRQ